MTDMSIGRAEAKCFPCSARSPLREARHHLPLTFPAFLAGVFVGYAVVFLQLQATLSGAQFGLLPNLDRKFSGASLASIFWKECLITPVTLCSELVHPSSWKN